MANGWRWWHYVHTDDRVPDTAAENHPTTDRRQGWHDGARASESPIRHSWTCALLMHRQPSAVAHSLGLPDNLLDFPTDTNRAVAQMHYTNRFARTPNVTYIFSHAGGSIPYLAARFAIIDEMGFIVGGEQRGTAADMFRRIYWDTALAASDPVLRMLRDVAGINQVLYGTDFPYLRRDLAVSSKQRIVQSPELNDSERRAILGGNASRLFPRQFRSLTKGVLEAQQMQPNS
jgi:hypothetical protein